ncbi:MAG: hypothetical protein JO039_06345 [Solirubrobacterales bacterium]|nr:hypothetical protein [Solirubrobacterales bacterium]
MARARGGVEQAGDQRGGALGPVPGVGVDVGRAGQRPGHQLRLLPVRGAVTGDHLSGRMRGQRRDHHAAGLPRPRADKHRHP